MQFKDVIGQEEIKAALINNVSNNKVPHAMLLLGEFGRGSFPIAQAFLQFLMCTEKTATDSCGNCSNCKRIEKLAHPDVHFTFPTVQAITKTADLQFSEWKQMILEQPYSNLNDWIFASDDKARRPIISVWESEALIKKLNLTTFEGGYKISVIWYAEEMNTTCANKLLKIIEEPPKKTIFILLAASESKILPTILSRTQILKIKPVEDRNLKTYLLQRGVEDENLAESIIARSNGNVATANSIFQSTKKNLYFNYFVTLMRVCFKKNVIEMLDWAKELSNLGREDQKQFLIYSSYMIRQSLIKNYTANQITQTSQEERDFLNNFAQFITGNNILEFYELVNVSHYNIERNAHGRLLFANMTFEVMRYIHKA